ncbi:hypothetical protein BH23BAC1_BH23BAC1_10320 [soil metagenome]
MGVRYHDMKKGYQSYLVAFFLKLLKRYNVSRGVQFPHQFYL